MRPWHLDLDPRVRGGFLFEPPQQRLAEVNNHGLRRLSSGGSTGRGTLRISTNRPGLGAIKNTRSPR